MTLTTSTPQPSSFFQIPERDILAELLADKRSVNTKRAYAWDLKDFFLSVANAEPRPQLVAEFLRLERFTAIALVLQYKAALIEKGLSEATVNRRLAAIKSLVKYAQKVGKCLWSLEEVEGERIRSYRDTRGVGAEDYSRILEMCDRSTLAGLRDFAILRLLWDNVLRRDEIHKLNVSDFDPEGKLLRILGKGRGTQAEFVDLSEKTVQAIRAWLQGRGGELTAQSPLFITLDRSHAGVRISGNGLYEMVRRRAEGAGLQRILSPHRCRHSGITQALDATGGDVRRVKKLSRHARTDTLLLYDDNRIAAQKQVTDILADLI